MNHTHASPDEPMIPEATSIRCMVCSGAMQYFMSKTFNSWGVTSLDYVKCVDCGFVACSTLLELPQEEWLELNNRFHTQIYKNPGDPWDRAGRLKGQARVIDMMLGHGLLSDQRPMLDWGSGLGDLAGQLGGLGRSMYSYDAYIVPRVNRWPGSEPEQRAYSLVTAAAVFEHLKTRSELDAIESLVAPDGVLAFHIAVPEQIPKDPNWVYLLPVHCAFHNWESLRRLMIQWGYRSCVYCHEALMWFFFRTVDDVRESVARINAQLGYSYLLWSEGFVSSTAVELPLTESQLREPLRRLYIGTRQPEQESCWEIGRVDFETAEIRLADGPVPTGAGFDLIYSDLVAERMEPAQFDQYLRAVRAMLAPRGVHRIVTSDLDRTLESARTGAWQNFPWVKQAGISSHGEYLNSALRSWGHKWIYDRTSLLKHVQLAGYRNVRNLNKGVSRLKSLEIAEKEGHRLYVEASL